MLLLIDKRLRQIFSENKNELFGRRSIIMFSNFGQLLLMLDVLMYITIASQNNISNDRIASYKQFKEVYKLDVM